MRILLIGASGQLGSDLVRNNSRHKIDAPDRDALDIGNAGQMTAYIRTHRPDMVVNCAAFHNVPCCEEQPQQAFLINCVAVRNLAVICQEVGAWLVTFSSDYVFGGNDKRSPYLESDAPAPLQIYGITRLAGEHAALASSQQVVVIRTCGLYGQAGARSKGGNFVDARIKDARLGHPIEIACEQIVAPTSTQDLSLAVLQLIDHPQLAPGIYHLVNEGECSWYELTCLIVECLGSKTKVVPVDRGGRTGAMRRPLYSVLANTRARALGISLRPWQAALQAYIKGKYASTRDQQSRGEAGE